jgi:geranylgeranyl pyrophosphate synthase
LFQFQEISQNLIIQRLEEILLESGVWPDYLQAMRQSLLTLNKGGGDVNSSSNNWISLPSLCCKAAGGDPIRAVDFTTAWFLFYLAADLMDDIQDQDVVNPWWKDLGPSVALNIASGLYFSASLALKNLYESENFESPDLDLVEEMYHTFLTMSGGQHRELVHNELNLEEYWKIAASKSGAFFGLACWGGACLASPDVDRLEGYRKFGHHLGILIQILDDLEEIKPSVPGRLVDLPMNFAKTLPAVFALEVTQPPIRDELLESLRASHQDHQSYRKALSLIDQIGAVLYIESEIERHRFEARAGLDQANPNSPEKELLLSILQKIYPES